MRFDELAATAGRYAAEMGRRADRPLFADTLERHRRRTLLAASTVTAVAFLIVVGGVVLATRGGPEPQAASPVTSIEPSSTTTTSAPGTTTLAGQPSPTPTTVGRDDCPVTFPGETPFTPASELPELTMSFEGAVWYGTPQLWTFIQEGGQIWDGLPVAADGSLTQKTFWWTEGYVSSAEPVPDVGFYAEGVGGSAPPVEAEDVTSGGHPEMGVFMIAGFEIPAEGCWRVTATYEDASVGYVAWVEGR